MFSPSRRSLILGASAILAAPALVRADSLMRIVGERYQLYDVVLHATGVPVLTQIPVPRGFDTRLAVRQVLARNDWDIAEQARAMFPRDQAIIPLEWAFEVAHGGNGVPTAYPAAQGFYRGAYDKQADMRTFYLRCDDRVAIDALPKALRIDYYQHRRWPPLERTNARLLGSLTPSDIIGEMIKLEHVRL